MKLTVDASIAIKWFVVEPLVDEARTVLTRRIQRHAPELLLAECANTIWKKVQRGEIPDAQPYREELANLPDILTLHPDRDFVERATEMAFRLRHPIYDCLYLACAEATASDLITADKRLVDKAAGRSPKVRVHDIGTPGVADWVESTGTSPVIRQDKIETLADAHELLAQTEQSVAESRPGGAVTILDTPAWRRLANLIEKLNDEETIDLLACGWFGAGLSPTWRQSFEHAERTFAVVSPSDVAQYGRHWRAGYARAIAEREAARPNRGTKRLP